MITHKLNDSVTLKFTPKAGFFSPNLITDNGTCYIPLLVAENEVEVIIDRLSQVNFVDLPLNFISMITKGCISTVLKYGGK